MSAPILYLVLTTAKHHTTRVQGIVETWGREVASQLLFMSDAPGPYKNIIALDSPPGDIWRKQILSLRYLEQVPHASFPWFFFCDDDTFVNTPALAAELATRDPSQNSCFCDPLNLYSPMPDLTYPAGGAGFAVSHTALLKLFVEAPRCPRFDFSDVAVGACMRQTGCQLIQLPGLHSQPPEYYRQRGPLPTRALTFHYIQPDRMHQLYANRDFL